MRPSSVSPYDLQDWAKRAGFELAEETLHPLAGYLGLLMQWNKVMNLVGTRTAEDTFFTLVVDSLHLGRFLREDVKCSAAPCCWDLGSGAGLPGIPLRMIWQEGDYWMVEAREKRALFLSTVLAQYPCPEPMSSGAGPKRLWPGLPRGQRILSSAGRLCRGPAFWNSSKAA